MIIEFKDVTKKFGDLVVIDRLNLSIKRGEFFIILGSSGCGKTTLLNMIAGFEKPSKGEVLVNGHQVKKPGKDRGVVFQDYALFSWKTVLGNVMIGLDNNLDKKEIAMKYLRKVGLEDFKDAYPYQLSGGMKQRVGIARALVYDPDILLMDEPFGALDAQTKKVMQQELLKILGRLDKTIVFVTHSVIEAVYLANRIIVMGKKHGQIICDIRIDLEGKRNYTSPELLQYRKLILSHLDPETGIHT